MNYKEIVALATKIKNYIEEKGEFPKEAKINGKTINYGLYAYYFSNFITQGGKAITDKKVKNASNPNGEKINEVITESDYTNQAKRISKFIEEKGQAPSNVATVKSKKTVKVQDYIYAFAKIVVYYSNHTRFPANVRYESNIYKEPLKKYGHATKSGCDNRGQNNGYFCGDHSLQEVIRNLTGIVVPQSTLASVCGTTTSGTDHDGLNTGVAWFNRKYGYNLEVSWKNFSDLGWKGIQKIINSNNQDCIVHNLYRNQWGHYEVINKVYDDYCEVQNSLGSYCSNGCYCGYVEERYHSTFRSYINGISQKSIMVITRK